jgi:ABC-type transport system involved in multi-copper enzyme maturation permease subunit
LLYVSLFFSLGLTISCLTHRATTSLFVSLFVWVAWVLAVPNVAPAVAKVIAPAPAMREIDAEKEAVDREIGLRMQRLQQTGDLTYGDKVKREQEKLEQEREDRKARWDKFVGDANRRQDRWAGLLGRLSPSASWIYTASEMSQTGPSVYERFEQARRRMQTGMKSKHDELTKAWQATAFTQAPPIVLETLPSLRMSYPSFSDSLDVALNDLLLLLILNVVFFMLGFMLFLRYDVR